MNDPPTVLAAMWLLLVLAGAWHCRPRRARRLPEPVPALPVAAGRRLSLVARRRALVDRRRRAAARRRELPELVDLVHVALRAGLNLPLTVAEVAARAPPSFADPLAAVASAISSGARAADALASLPADAGEVARPLVDALVSADRYGTPVLPLVERVSHDARLERARHAEVAARRVPVTMLFPLVACVLPAFALLTVVPLLAGTLRSVRL
jgi:pilus assembly protein TadC